MDHWKMNQELKPVRLLRHVNANNKYMKNVDKTKDSWYLIYLDKKNLYGKAICENYLLAGLNGMKYLNLQKKQKLKKY